MTNRQKAVKRIFDIVFSLLGLMIFGPLILVLAVVARVSSGGTGIFKQPRVGRKKKLFTVYKLRTMYFENVSQSSVTVDNDLRVTNFGRFLRKAKLDELPQLWNILIGDMSFVGPRPDVPGFADRLVGTASAILELRPGITGPATIKYRHEEKLLALQENPEEYNLQVIFPDKVELNMQYIMTWSLMRDVQQILITLRLMPCPEELDQITCSIASGAE